MTRSSSAELHELDPEIERTLRKNRKNTSVQTPRQSSDQEEVVVEIIAEGIMEGNQPRTNQDYARPTLDGTAPTIVKPHI